MSNSVSRSYPKYNQDDSLRQEIVIKPSLINAWSARLAEQVPFCPCPPETLSCAVKCDLDEVDGGILFPASVSHEAHLVAFNNHHASNCYCPCDECQSHYLSLACFMFSSALADFLKSIPFDGTSVPSNLE